MSNGMFMVGAAPRCLFGYEHAGSEIGHCFSSPD
jgi:hypothetical protein